MSSVSNISLFSMNAARTSLWTTAFNIAQAETEGHQRRRSEQTSLSTGGVASDPVQGDAPAGAGLETGVFDMVQATNSFLANVAVFRTGSKLTVPLLDIRA